MAALRSSTSLAVSAIVGRQDRDHMHRSADGRLPERYQRSGQGDFSYMASDTTNCAVGAAAQLADVSVGLLAKGQQK
ncbi:hypothetical protein GCM10007979_18970 [Nocardioides albus]|nr:hypothetical protein GCM10007979_18970 [Nocardioides albus]